MAVEPLEGMLGQLRRSLPAVPAVAGTAEMIPARKACFSGVVVAQAFHWFDAPAALREIARVMRPGGTLGILFNIRDESVRWVAELTDLIESRSGGRPYGDHRERPWGEVVAEDGRFDGAGSWQFDNPVPSSPAAVLERVRSTSFVALMEPESRAALLAEVADLIATHPETAGRVHFDYPHRTDLQLWTLAD